MKKGVKVLSVALAGMMLLAGCGSKEQQEDGKEGDKVFKVGIS